MHYGEHVALCIPLILHNITVDARNIQLQELFPPLNDELYSTYIADVLIGVGIVVAFAIPPLQYGLAYLYFTKGHPLSRILNSKILKI
jgi:hypothetical protein